MLSPTQHAVERIAREAYGKLVAFLAARSGDIAAAEDALAEAFVAALTHWPKKGVPERPENWLLTTAKRRLLDGYRHADVRAKHTEVLAMAEAELREEPKGDIFPDRRLDLLFACAHPAIDEQVHTPLMLQTVLGLEAAKVASAFLVAPTTMAQRLVRAKKKIATAGVPFVIPPREQLPFRLPSVLEAIYAAYGTGWDDIAKGADAHTGLAREALYLARLLVAQLHNVSEVRGLLALMLFCESRRAARRDEAGAYVPLSEQNLARWDRAMVVEGNAHLRALPVPSQPGRFQLEASIQSLHAARLFTGVTDHAAVNRLYRQLLEIAPTVGAVVSYAAALQAAGNTAAAQAQLAELPSKAIATYQPYWVLRAQLAWASGDAATAAQAHQRALGLTEDPAVRAFLQKQKPYV